MESLLLERIKKRDRWTCRLCGKRFVNLEVVGNINNDKQCITVCKECKDVLTSSPTEVKNVIDKLNKENKVVLVGDCHNKFSHLDSVLSSEEPFDFFLSVGDVGSLSEVEPNDLEIIEKWNKKGYFIRGNHDDVDFFAPLEIVQDINGLKIAGLNGILKSRSFANDKEHNISFSEILYLSHINNIDILVTHQPPAGLFSNCGETIFWQMLDYIIPKVYICGHVHSYKLKFHLNTFIISLPMINHGHAVAYFQGKDLRNIEVTLRKGKKVIKV